MASSVKITSKCAGQSCSSLHWDSLECYQPWTYNGKEGLTLLSLNHRMVWVGRDLTDHPVPPPAMGRDPFPQPRVLPAPSSLALSPARERAATASQGSLGQGLTTLMGKNFCLIAHLNLPSLSPKSSPPALVPAPPQLSQPLQALAAALRSPRSLLLPRLSSPSSPSLSS